MIHITIDGADYEAEEGATVLEVARANGIKIPTLCYHPALKPSGSCKLCAVEVPGKSGRQITMLSCVMRVREGLTVKTTGDRVDRARSKAFQNLLQQAPQSKTIRKMAAAFNIDLGPPPDGCLRCRLCIRVCKEIVGAEALKMIKREGNNYVVPVEGRCIGCGTCANICPTEVIRIADQDNVRTLYIRDEIIGQHPLEHCEGCGKLFATHRVLENVERRIGPHPEVKEHHRYCPTCAKLLSSRIKAAGGASQKLRLPGH